MMPSRMVIGPDLRFLIPYPLKVPLAQYVLAADLKAGPVLEPHVSLYNAAITIQFVFKFKYIFGRIIILKA